MDINIKKLNNLKLRKNRIRSKISGSAARPRMSLNRSLKAIRVQLIDDVAGRTLVSASTLDLKSKEPKIAQATALGKLIADKAKQAGIESVVFDRGGYRYHGRVQALADSAREAGLKF